MKKFYPLFLLLFLVSYFSTAQNNYEKFWKEVTQYELEGKARSAAKIVDKIYKKARRKKQSDQIVKSFIYKAKFISLLEENAQDKILAELEEAIKNAQFPTNQILQSVYASCLEQHFNSNRFKIRRRTKLDSTVVSNDYKLWDTQTYITHLSAMYQASLKNPDALLQIPIKEYSSIITDSKKSAKYRPTLYDFLAQRALYFFKRMDLFQKRYDKSYIPNNPLLLGTTEVFVSISFKNTDSVLVTAPALELFQKLETVHQNKDTLACIDVILERLQFVKKHSTLKEKDTLYYNTLQTLMQQYKTHEASAWVGTKLAEYWLNETKVANAKYNAKLKDNRVKALALCNYMLERYPEGDAVTKYQIIKTQLLSKKMTLQTEKFVIPQKPFLAQLGFKNIDSLYVTAYKVPNNYFKGYSGLTKDNLLHKLLVDQQPVIQKLYKLPVKNDLYEYTTEIDIPALPIGNYVLVACGAPDCKLLAQVYAYAPIQVTSLSLVMLHNAEDVTFQLLHRESGIPIEGATVKAKEDNFFNTEGKTDTLGMFTIKRRADTEIILKAELVHENDTLNTKTISMRSIAYNYEEYEHRAKSVIFLDRKIYRPGQTLFFKGILTEKKEGQKKVVPNTWVTITIYDANNEELKEFQLKTNSYGSVNGEYTIPKNVLTGRFSIEIEEGSDEKGKEETFWGNIDYFYPDRTGFLVEEYKRPRFEVNFNDINENYKLGDSIKVTGKAQAFFGAAISSAQVIYTIERMPLSGDPDDYYYEKETILEGTTETDAAGNFTIEFAAIPESDAETLKNSTFLFRVKATITDLNGETRENAKIVLIGTKSLKASLTIEPEIKADDKQLITVATNNLNDKKIPADVTLEIYKLKLPGRLLSQKPWDIVELPYLSKEDFIKKFPTEVYDSTDLKTHWPRVEKVFYRTFNTSKKDSVILKAHKNWEPGTYAVDVTATDKHNDTVKISRYFELYRAEELPATGTKKMFDYKIVNTQFKKDGYVLINLKTAAKNLNVFVNASYKYEKLGNKRIKITNGNAFVKIPVKPVYEDKMELKLYAVKHNRFLKETVAANFSKETKLNFETLSFRNRLVPDAKESWSFKITNSDKTNVAAEILASMYDESLDAYGKHYWESPDALSKYGEPSYPTSIISYEYFGNQNFKSFINDYYPRKFNYQIKYKHLKWFGFNFNNSNYSNKQFLKSLQKPKAVKFQAGKAQGFISGTVSDLTGPLPGAAVVQMGTTNGTQTDFDGIYSLNVTVGANLVFSYVGYRTEIVTVEEPGETIDVLLNEDSEALDEIVVIAYGNIARTPPLQKDTDPGSRILDKLGEKAAAIKISYVPQPTGRTKKLVIRANSSLNKKRMPLFIVDGKIVSVSANSGIDIITDIIEQIEVLKGAQAIGMYGEKGKNGVVIITTEKGLEALLQTETRTNLKETAFFLPTLTTNDNGEIQFNFKAPQALTKWKLMMLGHTKDLKAGGLIKTAVTQKNLNVVPNYPRFVREKDTLVFSAKLSNLTKKSLTGTAALQLSDALSMQPLDKNILLSSQVKNFRIDAKGNTEVSWKLAIPQKVEALQFKVVAKAGQHSDGEAKPIPVLSNRTFVTESRPLWVPAKQSKKVTFDKLITKASASSKNHKFSIEYTSNPAWLALKSLPYLIEFPHECAEQTFSRFYANSIAAHIVTINPKIEKLFETWRSENLTESVLEKNQELKSIVLNETPWVADAQSDSETKARLALLFETEQVDAKQQQALEKLKDMQMASGGFPWFKGGRENTFITQHIIAGFGHLHKMNIKSANTDKVNQIIKKGLRYLDKEFLKTHTNYLKKTKEEKLPFNTKIIHYLYTRSFYLETHELGEELQKIWPLYLKKSKEKWLTESLYEKALIALYLYRNGDKETAVNIIEALKEQAVKSEENGMYWKANKAGWYWYRSPIETQALLIEAFTEIENDSKVIDKLKMWLLKNKSTQHWQTTKATTEAIYALLIKGGDWLSVSDNTVITLGDKKIKSKKMEATQKEAGTGYFKVNWKANEITNDMSSIKVTNNSDVPGFGGAYWQYFEDMDKITEANNEALVLKKGLFTKSTTMQGGTLNPISSTNPVKIGDLLTVRIVITAKDDLEFVHLKDMRASGLEPVDVLSAYKWQDGLGYYQATKDVATHFFFDRLPKGTYVFEYELRANNSGDFSNGISTLQSMYAPAFSTNSKGVRIKIDN